MQNSSTIISCCDTGSNIITGNDDHGVYLSASSATLGEYDTAYAGYQGAENTIDGNLGKDIYALSSSTVVAENNWWGESPPSTGDFHISSNSTFDYDPWLTSAPSSAMFSVEEMNTFPLSVEYRASISSTPDGVLSESITSAGQFVRALQESRLQTSRSAVSNDLTTIVDSKSSFYEIATLYLLNDLAHAGDHAGVLSKGAMVLSAADYDAITKAEVAAILFRSYLALGETGHAIRMKDHAIEARVEGVDVEAMEMLLADRAATEPATKELTSSVPEANTEASVDISVYPNPFNPQTTFSLNLPETSSLRITIHDILGREVGRIDDTNVSEGTHSYSWFSGDLSSGTYLYRISADSFIRTGTLVVVK